jgi:hypothetical protein
MSSLSANDLIERAMVSARIIGPGESIPGGKGGHAYSTLLDLLESWSLDGVLVCFLVEENFTLTASDYDYSYGTGGDLSSERPLGLSSQGNFIRSGSTDYPLTLIDIKEYRSRFTNKASSGIPFWISYIPSFTSSRGMLYLNPAPDSAYDLRVLARKQLRTFSDRTTSVTFEPGYVRAMVLGLAAELAVSYGKDISSTHVAMLTEAMANIRSNNIKGVREVHDRSLAHMAGYSGIFDRIEEGP